jgi:hypothetical protein
MISSLVDVLRGDVCRHLLRATQNDDLAVFSLALRVVFNMFMSIKDHMKIQLEVFLTSVHLRLLQKSNFSPIPAREELALESLLEFCREPALMQDLYTNYDCDVQCTNLYDMIISTLCARAVPLGLQSTEETSGRSTKSRDTGKQGDIAENISVNTLNRLALYGLLSVLHAVCGRRENTQSLRTGSSTTHSAEFAASSEQPLRFGAHEQSCDSLDSEADRWCTGEETYTVSSSSSPIDELEGTANSTTPTKAFSERPLSPSLSPIAFSRLEEEEKDTDFVLLARARAADMLRQRKLRKQRLTMAAEKFNEKPLKLEWITFASELGLLPKTAPLSAVEPTKKTSSPTPDIEGPKQADAKAIAKFLKNTPGLGKTQIGEYLSKGPKDMYPFIALVLSEFVKTFDFTNNTSIDKAMRIFLGHFRLPGEAQCIDRLMEAFAGRLFEFLGPGKPFKSRDAAFVLAFSTIMLNTDLHNPQVADSKRMKKEEFVRNNRGINDGEDLPRDYLENLYDQIKDRQIQVDFDISDAVDLAVDYSETTTWDALLRSADNQAPAAFTPTLAARRWFRRGGALQSSVHDRDMFLVMAKPVLKTVLLVWESTDDEKLIYRMLEALQDFAYASVHFEVPEMLDLLVCLLVERVKVTIFPEPKISTKGKPIPDDFVPIKLSDIEPYFGPEFEQIVLNSRISCSKLKPSAISNIELGPAEIPNVVANQIRAELMLKVVLTLCSEYSSSFGKSSWLAFIELVCWAHARNILPSKMMEIDDFEDSNGVLLPLSQASFRCSDLACGRIPIDETTILEDEKSTGSGIWGFFFSSSNSSEEKYVPRFDQAGKLIREPKDFRMSRGKSILEVASSVATSSPSNTASTQSVFSPNSVITSRQELAYVCFVKSDILFSVLQGTQKLSSEVLTQIVVALVAVMKSHIADIQSAYTDIPRYKGTPIPEEPAKRLSKSQLSFVGTAEMGVVLIIEYLSKIMQMNKTRVASTIWPVFHEFLCSVFDESLDILSIIAPFLVERFIVSVLRSSILQSSFPNTTSIGNESTSVTFWSSLRLLRGVHITGVGNISERLAAGLYGLLKIISDDSIVPTIELENWYNIFSLLSTATVTPNGQKFVFEGLTFLIDCNRVNDINFSPCRLLLLRFLHNTFPSSSGEDNVKCKGIEATTTFSNSPSSWETKSLSSLMKLTLMALGGYQIDKKVAPGSPGSAKKLATTRMITFPLPVESMDAFSSRYLRSLLTSDNLSTSGHGKNDKKSISQISVSCVRFSRSEEVELLWTETCKIFSEVACKGPISSSRHALYLMQALQMAAGIVHLSKAACLRSLDEMLQRLPFSLTTAQEKFSTSDVVEICDISLRCCNLLFEVFVANFRLLSTCQEFSPLWLNFVCALAENLKIANRGLPIFDETVEMIGALLRLPRPLPVAVDVGLPQASTISNAVFLSDSPVSSVEDSGPAENLDEENLLRESWRRIVRISPSIPHILSVKHPKVVADLNLMIKIDHTMKISSTVAVSSSQMMEDSVQQEEQIFPEKKSNSGVFSVFGF